MDRFSLPATDKWNYESHFYDMQLLSYVGAIFDPTRPVVDVRANVGYVVKFLALRCRSTVTAFEPSRRNYKALVKNTAGLDNVRCYLLAIGHETRKVSFLDNATVYSHIVGKKSRSKNIRKVQMTTLDDVVAEDVKLLKIDVEGYEMGVLEGARGLLERCRLIVVLETMDRWLKRQGDSTRTVVELFARTGVYQSPVNKFGEATTQSSDLIFAPKGVFLHRPYVSFRKQEKLKTCSSNVTDCSGRASSPSPPSPPRT